MDLQDNLKYMIKIAEEYFGTESDPTQIPITLETMQRLLNLGPHTLVFAERDKQPIGWVVTIPTTNELKDQFLKDEITERELFDQSQPKTVPEVVYLCAAFVLPEYRRQGIAFDLLAEAVARYRYVNPEVNFFAWIYSAEGQKLVERLSNQLSLEIETKK